MNYKFTKIALASTMVFGMQFTNISQLFAADHTAVTSTVSNTQSMKVKASLKNATNIANNSMASGALMSEATLEIVDDKMYATIEFQTLKIGNIEGNATKVKYYPGALANKDAVTPAESDVTLRTLADGSKVEKTVRIPVIANETGSYGTYLNITISPLDMAQDAYVEIDVQASLKEQLVSKITNAKTYKADAYTQDSFASLQTAIIEAQGAIDDDAEVNALQDAMNALDNAIAGLVKIEEPVDLADGTYRVPVNVLKIDGVNQSMAASAVKGASITVKNNEIVVDLELGAVSAYGQTAYIERLDVENTTSMSRSVSTWETAEVTKNDAEGHVRGVRFTLSENLENTNVKFYYGGSEIGSDAILYLGLNDAEKQVTSVFESDGTYEVNVALWNATSDQASMAASAISEKATITVENGKAMMYVTSKKMMMGSITAYLQELKVNNGTEYINAKIFMKDSNHNPTIFSFDLPSEDAMLDVKVNPMVALMGNSDIPARLKVDYTTLEKVSNDIKKPSQSVAPDASPEKTPNATPEVKPTDTTTPNVSETIKKEASPKTGDTTRLGLYGGLLFTSIAGIFLAGVFFIKKKKLCRS
ncbi:NEAT domain-containing protein [Amedibacillus sp. YH-ame10]